jgi:hypothetical protein
MGPFCIDCLDIDELGLNNSLLVLVMDGTAKKVQSTTENTFIFVSPQAIHLCFRFFN